jgi:hypothetical protein
MKIPCIVRSTDATFTKSKSSLNFMPNVKPYQTSVILSARGEGTLANIIIEPSVLSFEVQTLQDET